MGKLRNLGIGALLLANLLMFVHLAVPHHHHGETTVLTLPDAAAIFGIGTSEAVTHDCGSRHHRHCSGGSHTCFQGVRQVKNTDENHHPAVHAALPILSLIAFLLPTPVGTQPLTDYTPDHFRDHITLLLDEQDISTWRGFRAPPVF